jgi:hypothetical protein
MIDLVLILIAFYVLTMVIKLIVAIIWTGWRILLWPFH